MNFICLTGRLTATPELKTTPNGKSVCSFTLAVERTFKGADGKPIVDFIDFVAWEHNAEFLCRYFDKGVKVAVTGELQTRLYEDKNSGKKIKVSEVLVKTVEFADGKRESNANTNANVNTNANTNTFAGDINDDFIPVDDDESLPF